MIEDVTYKKLGEVATYVNGYAFKPETWSEKGLPIIRIQNLNNGEAAYNYYEGDLPAKFIVEKGDLLISWSASLGSYFWQGEKAYLNQHIFKVVFDKSDIDKTYLKYAVDAKLEEMKRKVHGATMQHIVKKDFDDTLIPVPSLEDQQRIVRELDAIHAILDAKNGQLRELDNLAQAIFYDMFGDPITNEKGWEMKKLGEIAKFLNGDRGVNYPSAKDFIEDGIPFINAGHLKKGKVDFDEMNYISETRYNLLHAGKVQRNDILFCLRGSLGKYAIVDFDRKGAIASSLVIIRSGEEVVPTYICNYLQSHAVKEQIERANNGSSQPNLSAKSVAAFTIPLPPLDLQQAFASKISAIEQQKELIRASITETETLLAAHMQHYFD